MDLYGQKNKVMSDRIRIRSSHINEMELQGRIIIMGEGVGFCIQLIAILYTNIELILGKE